MAVGATGLRSAIQIFRVLADFLSVYRHCKSGNHSAIRYRSFHLAPRGPGCRRAHPHGRKSILRILYCTGSCKVTQPVMNAYEYFSSRYHNCQQG